jgi:hypothetical protein
MPARYTMLLFSVFLICCREYPGYSEGGFPYPKNITHKDTNNYHYQIVDSMKPRDAV